MVPGGRLVPGVHVGGEEGLQGEAVAAGAARERLDGGVLGTHVRLGRNGSSRKLQVVHS